MFFQVWLRLVKLLTFLRIRTVGRMDREGAQEERDSRKGARQNVSGLLPSSFLSSSPLRPSRFHVTLNQSCCAWLMLLCVAALGETAFSVGQHAMRKDGWRRPSWRRGKEQDGRHTRTYIRNTSLTLTSPTSLPPSLPPSPSRANACTTSSMGRVLARPLPPPCLPSRV